MSSFGPTSFAPTSGSVEAQVPGTSTDEWGPVSSHPVSGDAYISGGDAGKPLWAGDLSVEKLTATVVLGADYEAYGVVQKISVAAVMGADYNAYGVVQKLSVAAVVGNDPNVPGTIRKSTVSVVLSPKVGDLDQAALHVVTGGTSAYGLLEQEALHAVTGGTSGYGLLEQEALHAVTGGTSGYGLLEQAALHAVVYDLPAVRPVIISINT